MQESSRLTINGHNAYKIAIGAIAGLVATGAGLASLCNEAVIQNPSYKTAALAAALIGPVVAGLSSINIAITLRAGSREITKPNNSRPADPHLLLRRLRPDDVLSKS